MAEKPNDIEAIYNTALKKGAEAERVAYLDAACGDDAVLRARVEELLKAHEEAGDFLEVPVLGQDVTVEESPLIEGPGTIIGRYELLELIGEGGMGLVYLAEQKEPVRRRVALKIIKPGMDSKEVIARFEAERQALALLDHPNIAHVFDAGTTKAGRPYFVMEYVRGMSITKYSDEHRLNIEQRLRLFEQVCEGVHHAHQKGIIHRDLKPSNILISIHGDKAVPKIIDFGIAKAITQPLTEETFFTHEGQLLGTPEYMSPEQVDLATQDIDTRSDIYSLGVVLYELLAGVLPFDRESLENVGFAEIQQTIREQEPTSPSIRLTSLGEKAKTIAASRGTQVIALARRLHRELEWIPLKAMRKDRCRRYRSASEMADDVRNYLNGLPLIAGPETARYRVRKFIHKHAGSVATVALVAVVIVLGFAFSTAMYFRAEQALKREAVARTQAEQAREKEATARAEAEWRAKILAGVNEFFATGLLAKGPQATVQEVVDTMGEIFVMGKIFGQEKWLDGPIVEASIRQMLGNAYGGIGQYKAAEPHLQRAIQLFRDELGESHPDTLQSMKSLACLYTDQGRYDKAEPLFIKVLETQRRVLGEEQPSTLMIRSSMKSLAALYIKQGRYDKAEPLYVKALESQRRVLGEKHPETLHSMGTLAWVYTKEGRYDKAEPLYVEVLDVCRRVNGEEHQNTLKAMNSLAWLRFKQGRYDEAESLDAKVLEIRRRLLGEENKETLHSMSNLASDYGKQGRYEDAERLQTRALVLRRRTLGEDHHDTLISRCNVGLVYCKQGRYDEAEALLVKGLETSRRVLGEEHGVTLWFMKDLGLVYCGQARYDEAEELVVKALEVTRRKFGEQQWRTLESMNDLAVLYRERGRYEEAEQLFAEALASRRRTLDDDHPDTLTSMSELALLYLEQGRYNEVEPLATACYQGRSAKFGPEHTFTKDAIRVLVRLYEAWGKPEQAEQWRAKLPSKKGKEEQ